MAATGAAGELTRPTFWHIGPSGKAMFYYLAAVAIAVFLYGVYARIASYARGADEPFDRVGGLPGRILRAVKVVLSNERQFARDRYAGVMHGLLLWGFLTLTIGTFILAVDLELVRPLTALEGQERSFFVGEFYLSYSFVMDALGLLFVVGVGMAIYRRYWVRNHRLWGRHTSLEDDLFLWTLFLLGVGGFLTEGVRILGQGFPPHETVSFVGWFVADALAIAGVTPAGAVAVYPWVWWSHAVIALAFVATIPYAKPVHMLTSFANVVAHDPDGKAGVRLPGVPADLDAGPAAEDIYDFSWRELLDHDACTKCGRCAAVCPAKAAGRPLDPRDVILDLKGYRESVGEGHEPRPIIADGGSSVIDAATMESCLACMACMEACPVEIEHLKSFTRLNRHLVDTGTVRPAAQDVFENLLRSGNAFGSPSADRGAWTDELDFEVADARETAVEYLWYVGDYPSYDARNRRVARAVARLFDAADVSYGILFDGEGNDGNDVRRLGEEFLYVELAGRLVDSFDACEYEEIVCTDPHSFNTIKNEYPEIAFEGFADDPLVEFEIDERWNPTGAVGVSHWTQVVASLVQAGRLELGALDYTVTYHDPCHLGRFNGEYAAPRDLIEATGCTLVEMPRNRADSFCCGGGGGGAWLDFDDDPKPSEERLREGVEDTAAGGDVEKFVVACPMCMTMFEDGRKTGGFEAALDVVDVAELLVEAMDASVPA